MNLHLMCGIPGSGKSTVASRIPGYIVSTDSLRKYLWQDEAVIKHDKFVFDLAERIIDYMLGLNQDVIFDATNLTVSKRKRFINLAKKHGAKVILHWINCPLETAIERNLQRDRQVVVEIIKALHKSFQRPRLTEGIDVIKVYGPDLLLNRIIYSGFKVNRHYIFAEQGLR